MKSGIHRERRLLNPFGWVMASMLALAAQGALLIAWQLTAPPSNEPSPAHVQSPSHTPQPEDGAHGEN